MTVRDWNRQVLEHLQDENRSAGTRSLSRSSHQLPQLLEQRSADLRELIRENPAEAVLLAFPAEVADQLKIESPEAQAFIETRGTWRGPADAVWLDAEDGSHRLDLSIETGDGRLAVFLSDHNLATPACNDLLEVQGVRLGNDLAAEAVTAVPAVELRGDSLSAADLAATLSCGPTGVQNSVVLMVQFPSFPLSSPTAALLNSTLFGSTGKTLTGYWADASYGKTSATGDVFGIKTLSKNYTCDLYYEMLYEAIALFDAEVDFTKYTRIFVVFPRPATGCSWAGMGNVGCRSYSTGDGTVTASAAWLLSSSVSTVDGIVRLFSHEGGHNLGLSHSASRDHGAEPIGAVGTAGTMTEYGDHFSAMGTANSGHYTIQQKLALGWLTTTNVKTVSTSGSFSVEPVSDPSATIRALKIQRGTGNNAWLWLESRQPIGLYDAGINAQAFAGAVIHYNDVTSSSKTELLDFTPATVSFDDGALIPGSTWDDPYTDLSLRVDSVGTSGVGVTVAYGAAAAPCTAANPTVTLSPTTATVSAGASKSFTVSVKNNDSTACASGTFAIASAQPAGWASSFSASSLSLAPGATGTVTLTKTAGTSLGTFTLNATATRGSNTGSATAAITVTAPCTAANPTVTLTPGTVSIGTSTVQAFTVSVKNNDSSSCSSGTFSLGSAQPASWTSSLSLSSVTLAPGASGSVVLTKTSGATAGTFTADATATRGSNSATGTSTITVTAACVAANPTVTLSPPSASMSTSSSQAFTVSVKNNDSASCSSGAFTISSAQPAGWVSSLSASTLTLAPGATGTVTMNKTSGTTAGTFVVNATATKGANVGSGTSTVTVTEACTEANATITLSPSTVSIATSTPQAFTVTVKNNDTSSCSAGAFSISSAQPAGWTSSLSAAALTLAPGATGTVTLTKTSGTTTGAFTVDATATKGARTASGTAAVTVVAACTTANPTVTLSPSTATIGASTSQAFVVSVRNNDSASCSSGAFTISSAQPSGWASNLSASSLTLAPGATGTVTLTKTSGTTGGSFTVDATATKGTKTATGVASVTVNAGACTTAAPTLTMSPSTAKILPGGSYTFTLTVKNNDSAGCAASAMNVGSDYPLGWPSTISPAVLTLAPGATGTVAIGKTASTAVGNYIVRASATKGSVAVSAQVIATVTLNAPVVTVAASLPDYQRKDTASVTALASNGTDPLPGANTLFTVRKPDGTSVTSSTLTDPTGRAYWSGRIQQRDPIGPYLVTVTVTSPEGVASSASTAFQVGL